MSDLNHRSRGGAEDTETTGPINTGHARRTQRGHRPVIPPHHPHISRCPSSWAGLFVTVLVNVIVPRLEVVGEAHSAPMTTTGRAVHEGDDAAGSQLPRIRLQQHRDDRAGKVSNPLGDDAHRLLRQPGPPTARGSQAHPNTSRDFWGDRLTAAGAQSADAKGAYVMLNLAGNQGTTQANDSVDAVRKVIERNQAHPGWKAYVTGPAALSDDMHLIGNASLAKITLFTLGGHRDHVAAGLIALLSRRWSQLFMTFVALACSRGSRRGSRVSQCIRAHHVRRQHPDHVGDRGWDRLRHSSSSAAIKRHCEPARIEETAYYTTFRGVAPVVLGSGLTIAGANLLSELRPAALVQTPWAHPSRSECWSWCWPG